MKADIGLSGQNMQKLDMNYVAEHHGRKSESQMEVKACCGIRHRSSFGAPLISTGGCSGAEGAEKEGSAASGRRCGKPYHTADFMR